MNTLLFLLLTTQVYPEKKPHPKALYMGTKQVGDEHTSTDCEGTNYYHREVGDALKAWDVWCIPQKCYVTLDGKVTCYELK